MAAARPPISKPTALVCAVLAALVVTRNVPFLGIPLGPFEEPFREIVRLQSLLAILQLFAIPATAVIAASAGVVLLVRGWRSWWHRDADGTLHLAAWLAALLWIALLLNNAFLDGSPRLASLCAVSLPLLSARVRAPLARRSRPLRWGAVAVLIALGVSLTLDAADALALLVWAAFLALLIAVGLQVRDRVVLALLGVAGVQILAGLIPLVLTLHDGVRIGDGNAYSFCESVEHEKIFAAIQTCNFGAHHCLGSHIAEHDRRDPTRRVRHDFFDPAFVGRPQQLVCLGDVVQVGMNQTFLGDEMKGDNVFEFDIDDPRAFRRDAVGEGAGYRIAWDRRRDAVFYSSEWNPLVFRLDRRSGILDRSIGSNLLASGAGDRWVVGNTSIHPERDRIYFGTMTGGLVAEMDLASLEVTRLFPVADAMFLFPTVDVEADRLWVTGQWGLTVIDLEGGDRLLRRRLGHFNRPAVIDAEHDLVYVTATFEGKIRALDRESFEMVGSIPVGVGPRVPLVSPGTGRLLAGSASGYYAWDTGELSRTLRGPDPEP